MSEAQGQDTGFDGLLAQPGAVQVLRHALDTDRVAQAYLFEGPSGVGKQRAALALATALLCRDARSNGHCACTVCERIRNGNHPDVRVWKPRDEGNRNLPVEVVRNEVLPFARFAPFEAPAACVIFPEADVSLPLQHAEAANALLKTLEEPRPKVTFVLLAERPDRLLSTIRSRCQRVRFRPLPAAVLQEILTNHGVAEEDRAAAIALSQGRADRALLLAQDGQASNLLALLLRVDEAIAQARSGDLLELAHGLAQNEQLELLLSALALFYRDVARVALSATSSAGHTPESDALLSFPAQRPLLEARAASVGAQRAAERVEALAVLSEALAQNANAETALDALLLGFTQPGSQLAINARDPKTGRMRY